jgi:hypothetical protein
VEVGGSQVVWETEASYGVVVELKIYQLSLADGFRYILSREVVQLVENGL